MEFSAHFGRCVRFSPASRSTANLSNASYSQRAKGVSSSSDFFVL